MKSNNKFLLTLAFVATKAAVGEGAVWLLICLSVDGATVFVSKKKHSGTAKTPLFHSYFGALLSGPHPRLRSFLLGTRLTSRPLCMNVNRCSESMQNRIINDVFHGFFLPSAMPQSSWQNKLFCQGRQEHWENVPTQPQNEQGWFYSMLIERQS